jgi:hypothetical protein
MKYLKRFSETLDESSINESHADDIILNVKDILLPISDMGYDISIIENNKENLTQFVIRVVSWGDQSLLITDEVKEEFIRMRDYLESEGYNSIEVLYHLATPGVIASRDIKKFDDFMKYEPWQKVKIQNLIFVATK